MMTDKNQYKAPKKRNSNLDGNTYTRLKFLLRTLNKKNKNGERYITSAERTAFLDIIDTIKKSVFQRTYHQLQALTGKSHGLIGNLLRKLEEWGIIQRHTLRKKHVMPDGRVYFVNTPLKIYIQNVTVDNLANGGGHLHLKPPSTFLKQSNRKIFKSNNKVIFKLKNKIGNLVNNSKNIIRDELSWFQIISRENKQLAIDLIPYLHLITA